MEEKQPSYMCGSEEWGRYLASLLPRFRTGDFVLATATLEPLPLKDVGVTTKLEPLPHRYDNPVNREKEK